MHQITLISSFHLAQGKCNPNELFKILEEINPDVIFEELSKEGFEMVYSQGYIPKTVEAFAIKEYLKKYDVKHFPVDTFPIKESELLSDVHVVLDNSVEYLELWNRKLMLIQQEGYAFLNSDECTGMLEKLSGIEEAVFNDIEGHKLLNEFKREKILSHNREIEMLKNIVELSVRYSYNQAVFICGAEHRRGFKSKIKDLEASGDSNLNWLFFNEQ